MKLFLLVFVIVVVGLILLWHFGKRPYKHRKVAQDKLEEYLMVVLKRGFNGGFLVIKIPNSSQFVQFSKYIREESGVGLQFDFPMVSWSENYYESVKSEASKNEFRFSVEKGSDNTEFITIDSNQDTARAVELATLIFQS